MRHELLIDAVLAGWRERARASGDPTPRGGERGERERALVRFLVEATNRLQGEHEEAALRSVALTAVAYGGEAHRARVDPMHLLRELTALRCATWDVLRAETPAEAEWRILRFDRALSIAYRVTLRSSHWDMLHHQGAWAGTLDGLVDEALREERGGKPRKD